MAKILHLLQFTADSSLKPDADVNSASDASENQRRRSRIVVIPFRSPNDQLQLVAIRPFDAQAEGNPNFSDYND
jgi:hypothetical protein